MSFRKSPIMACCLSSLDKICLKVMLGMAAAKIEAKTEKSKRSQLCSISNTKEDLFPILRVTALWTVLLLTTQHRENAYEDFIGPFSMSPGISHLHG